MKNVMKDDNGTEIQMWVQKCQEKRRSYKEKQMRKEGNQEKFKEVLPAQGLHCFSAPFAPDQLCSCLLCCVIISAK